MRRRDFLPASLGAGLAATAVPKPAPAASGPIKITRVRYYQAPDTRPIFNQSSHIVTVETDAGITGIGEGGHRDSIEQLAGLIIGEDAGRIEHLWQLMYRHYFYPPGREKIHALGALDLALWDIKGKALGVPVWELLGGKARDYVECYSTGFPRQGTTSETAQACIEYGFRALRTSVTGAGGEYGGQAFDPRRAVDATYEHCKEVAEGVQRANGDWAIDYHTRLDLADAVRLSDLIFPLNPLFVEDPVRSENPEVYRTFRPMVKVPLAVGEHYGDRWDANMLIENQLFDYSRVSIPNCGGITEFRKLAAICETHYVGLIPHFTGPVSEASLVHCLTAMPGPAVMEMRGKGDSEDSQSPHLLQTYDFRNGKMYPRPDPGLGCEIDVSRLDQVLEVTEKYAPIPLFQRPDGSITNW